MFGFVVQDCGKRVAIQPWRWQDICASLALEQQGKPQRNVGTVGWVQRPYRSLHIKLAPYDYTDGGGREVGGGVLEGHTHPEKLESLESLARDNRDELHFA